MRAATIANAMVGLLSVSLLVLAAPAWAQATYPSKPIRVVAPYPPGGNSDSVARIVSERMSARLGVPFVIENKGGASGQIGTDQIGTEQVIRAEPDGYTLLSGNTSNFTLQPNIRKVSYALSDLKVIGGVAEYVPVMAARKDLGVKTLQEFIELARKTPNLKYGSSGVGSTSHVTSAALANSNGISMIHVPFKGSSDALVALVGGQIDLLVDGVVPTAMDTGKITPLAAFSKMRHAALPDVPTYIEAGAKVDLGSSPTWVWFAPKGMDDADAAKLSATLKLVLDEPDTQERLKKVSTLASWLPPDEMVKSLQKDAEFFKVLLPKIGVNPE